jgi:predicted nuclease of predicted toxin-antitoxin system
MRFVIDMNLSPTWADFLKSAGHEAVHWSDIGPANAPDEHVLAWAAANDHIVVTNDLDFAAILAASGERTPSVIQLRSESLRPDRVGPAVLGALDAAKTELAQGALLTIDPARARLHILPLTSRTSPD